jgi:hypothetical protein
VRFVTELEQPGRLGPGIGWDQAPGPADHSYVRVAEETGGIPFFFERSEVSRAMKFTAANSGEKRVTLLWATAMGSLQGTALQPDSMLLQL